jgi:hypothetical protein
VHQWLLGLPCSRGHFKRQRHLSRVQAVVHIMPDAAVAK